MGLAARALDVPSLTAGRQAIVAALTPVPGVYPTMSKPDEPMAGSAWPRWAISQHEGVHLCGMAADEFDVYVLLNAGYEPSTVDEGDVLRDACLAALWPIGRVIQSQPTLVIFDTQRSMPALLIRVSPRI
jgi:hypothetical protein